MLSNFDDATYLRMENIMLGCLSHCFIDANSELIPDWEISSDEVLYLHKLMVTNDQVIQYENVEAAMKYVK